MTHLVLYVDSSYTSPYAMSVYVALQEKALPFSIERVDLEAGAHQQAPYRDLGLTGRVPTLLDGDFALSESSAIIEYLEECFGAPQYAPVLPPDARQRAQARQIQAWLRSDLMPIRSERNTGVIFFEPIATPLSEEGQASAARLIRIAERLVDGPNLFGQWCIADTELALMLKRLIMNGDPVPQKLKDYAALQWQRPAVQQWMGLPRPRL
ncbi:MAG: glutathione transferase [Pseudomonadota bacterium]